MPWTAACQSSLFFTISQSLLKFISIESTDAIQPSHPLPPPFPFSFSLSQHQNLFQWVTSSHKVLELQLQHQSFQWIVRVDSFRIVWLGFEDSEESSPAPQFESINSLAFNLLYGTTLISVHGYWETIALTIQTFVGKVMSFLFNTLAKFVIAFLPRSKHLLISWLESPSTVILELRVIKSVTASTFPLLFAMKW